MFVLGFPGCSGNVLFWRFFVHVLGLFWLICAITGPVSCVIVSTY